MTSAFLGLDIGTSTIKAGIFTADGRELAVAAEEYMRLPEGQEWVEFAADTLWQAACRVVRAALAKAVDARVAAVSIATHAETLVFLDAEGRPVRPAIFTTDCRAGDEARDLVQRFGMDWLLRHTGQPEMTGAWPCSKLLWLTRHEPEALQRTAHVLLPADYVIYRLSGAVTGEPSAWGSSVMVDLAARDWLAPMLDAVGVCREQLPPLVAPGTRAGTVTSTAAAATGLPAGTAVVVGAMDQSCAAIGAGNVRPGIVSVSTGSVLALHATTDRPLFDAVTKVGCYAHPVPGTYCLLPWNPTGGL
ncbi:MAG: FGGY-family carbohydrate kinase, partial [Anaerolineae bacterium]